MASDGDKPPPGTPEGATASPAAGAQGDAPVAPTGDPPAATAGDPPAASPVAEPAEKPAEKPADPPAIKPGDKPADPAAAKAVDKPAAKPVDKPADKPAAKAVDKAVDKPADKAVDKPADKPAAKPVDKPAAKPVDKPADKPAEDPRRVPDPPPWYRTLRADPPSLIRLGLGLFGVGLLVGLWWFLTRGGDELALQFNGRKQLLSADFFPSTARIVDHAKLPSPAEVFGSFDTLWDRELLKHLFASLERVFVGIGLAAIVGVALGIYAGSQRGVLAGLTPLVIFLRSVPMAALIPITLALFGVGEAQKTRFIFLAVVPFVFSDTVKAVSIIPERYVETAQTLGASRFQIIRKVLIPLSLPEIITGLRFMFGLALGYIMLAEEIDTEFGLGKLIFTSFRQGPIEHVYLILFIIAFVALAIDFVLRTLQRAAFAWRKDL